MAMNWQSDASANQSPSKKQDECKDQYCGDAGMIHQMSFSDIHQMDYSGNDITNSAYNNNGITSIPSTSNIVTSDSNRYNSNNNNNNIAWAPNSNGNFNNNANNNNTNYNNNNNNNNNIHNNINNNDNIGDRSNLIKKLDSCVSVSLVICIILSITALVTDTLTIHSVEYCTDNVGMSLSDYSYSYSYSQSCQMCDIEYGMHQFRVVECGEETFGSTDYDTLCVSNLNVLYCHLELQGDIYETSMIIGLVARILSLFVFVVFHIRLKKLWCNGKFSFKIVVCDMCVKSLANATALGGWEIDNGIDGIDGINYNGFIDFELQYSNSYVRNEETAWGISLWCTVIVMAFDVAILMMIRIIFIYNKAMKSAKQEARGDETVCLNNGAVNMPPQIVSYNNNNGNYCGNYNNQSLYGWPQAQAYPQQSQFQQQQQY